MIALGAELYRVIFVNRIFGGRGGCLPSRPVVEPYRLLPYCRHCTSLPETRIQPGVKVNKITSKPNL
jgi:hypothetical protein